MIIYLPKSSNLFPLDMMEQFLLSDIELKIENDIIGDPLISELFCGDLDDFVQPDFSSLICNPTARLSDKGSWAQHGMGAIPTKTHQNGKLRKDIDRATKASIINNLYLPHHDKLNQLVHDEIERHGFCFFIEGTTFHDEPMPFEPDQISIRPDISIGTDRFHTPRWLATAARRTFSQAGLSVETNIPYKGCFIPNAFTDLNKKVLCLKISINRNSYLKHNSTERNAKFEKTQQAIFRLKQIIKQTAANHKET